MIKAQISPIALSAHVVALLSANHLPTEDLHNNEAVSLFGASADGALVGVIGLERHGSFALLRSLAVSEPERNKGLGISLVQHLEQHAFTHGTSALYLLTTSAAQFFERCGFKIASRQEAPPSIATTRQFSSLCPASSAFMVKCAHG